MSIKPGDHTQICTRAIYTGPSHSNLSNHNETVTAAYISDSVEALVLAVLSTEETSTTYAGYDVFVYVMSLQVFGWIWIKK